MPNLLLFMPLLHSGFLLATLLALTTTVASYDLVKDHSGQDFFDGWDFYGSWDNLTLGDVWWLNQSDAFSQGLAYINNGGRAVIKVDNASNVPFNEKRNSVRITTQDFYSLGSLWIIDIWHLPYGCSVWPAFWSKGLDWPEGGEIDIIEAVNLMPANQMALHTLPGCTRSLTSFPPQLGAVGNGPNATDCSLPPGCVVGETKQNSFGSGFASAGGGVWAVQYDIAGVFMWFWSRPNIPASIRQATSTSSIELADWGPPSASYPNITCDMPKFFTDQQLVLDITLCGNWAGIGPVYNASCGSSGPTGLCYNDNVVGPGSPRYDNAYFEISYVRTYTTAAAVAAASPTNSLPGATPSTSTTRTIPTPQPDVSGGVVVTNAAVGRLSEPWPWSASVQIWAWTWLLASGFAAGAGYLLL